MSSILKALERAEKESQTHLPPGRRPLISPRGHGPGTRWLGWHPLAIGFVGIGILGLYWGLEHSPSSVENSSPPVVVTSTSASASRKAIPSPQPELNSPGPASVEADPLKDLKIQAIFWDAEPGKRIAVINGQVLKEGDGLEGMALVRIEEGAVVMTTSQGEFVLAFEYP